MLAFDHGYIMGPTSGLERLDLGIVPLIPYADSIMCSRGSLRSVVPADSNKAVCLRYSAGTSVLTELTTNVVLDIRCYPAQRFGFSGDGVCRWNL